MLMLPPSIKMHINITVVVISELGLSWWPEILLTQQKHVGFLGMQKFIHANTFAIRWPQFKNQSSLDFAGAHELVAMGKSHRVLLDEHIGAAESPNVCVHR